MEDVPGLAGRFLLRVRLGGYEESTLPSDTRREWAANETPQKGEPLAPLQQVGIGRPATLDWTSFTGGLGRVREALDDRARKALAFASTSDNDRKVVELTLKAFSGAWA